MTLHAPSSEVRNALICTSLEKIIKLCGSKSKLAKVKQAAARLSALLRPKKPGFLSRSAPPEPAALEDAAMLAALTEIFDLVIASKAVPLVEVVLNCMHKLLAYSCIRGDSVVGPKQPTASVDKCPPEPEVNMEEDMRDATELSEPGSVRIETDYVPGSQYSPGKTTVTMLWVDLICKHLMLIGEEGLHLPVVQCLLTAVTNPICEIHEATMQLVIRTIYSVYLSTKRPNVQKISRGSLVHIVQLCQERLERFGGHSGHLLPGSPRGHSEAGSPRHAVPKRGSLSGGEEVQLALESPERRTPEIEAEKAEDVAGYLQQLVKSIVSIVLDPAPPTPVVEVADLTADHPSSSPIPSPVPDGLPDDKAGDGAGGEAAAQPVVPRLPLSPQGGRRPGAPSPAAPAAAEPSVLLSDSLMIFKALCKLSQKRVVDPANNLDSQDMRAKVLALELLYELLSRSGPVMRDSPAFVVAIKENLCVSLLQNCVSPIAAEFQPALSIFTLLTLHFREHLKTELGVFFQNVLLAILDSPNATFAQKFLVAQALHRISEDPRMVMDLFLNYDCDLDSSNVYEGIVSHVSRLVCASHAEANWVTKQQEQQMKSVALETLALIAKSMVDWITRLGGDMEATAEDGTDEDSTEDTTNQCLSSARDVILNSPHTMSEALERTLQRKRLVRQAVEMFNKKGKSGVDFLTNTAKLVERCPQDVALWLRHTAELDCVQIGEYLAGRDEFTTSVMHAYIETFDFTGLEIDDALRTFLSEFKIAGEAQVIDRIMEKFAEIYCQHNPKAFSCADTAYVLCFSIIMLNTDAHSPSVEHKMSQSDFVRNNTGIDEGRDLPRDYLCAIYDRIVSREIRLKKYENVPKETPTKSKGSVKRNHSKKKLLNYKLEVETLVQRSKELLGRTREQGSRFVNAHRLDHIKPMFEISWAPMRTCFAMMVEATDAEEVVQTCLNGFHYCIQISCQFGMDDQRETFIRSLSKLTLLDELREMRPKNVASLQLLLRVATDYGDHLGSSWLDVLRCISQLERLKVVGAGPSDASFLQKPPAAAADRSPRLSAFGGAADPKRDAGRLQDQNARLIAAKINNGEVDRIFSKSRTLSADAVVSFVQHLCQVSEDEIFVRDPPFTFSLQKLIEVADLNMDRMRFVWTKIWAEMAKHFVHVAGHPNLFFSMFAIDSLKQLAMKFLEKQELGNYMFQRDFLKPFESIFANSNSHNCLPARDLILRCLAQMVVSKGPNIKSGWKSIVSCFALAAQDPQEGIVTLGFEGIEGVMDGRFHFVTEIFVDVVNCLISFACNAQVERISLRSLDHLQQCAEYLVLGVPVPNDSPASRTADEGRRFIIRRQSMVLSDVSLVRGGSFSMQDKDDKGRGELLEWFPILTGLSLIATNHPMLSVRTKGLAVLFDILGAHGALFSTVAWDQLLGGVVYPLLQTALAALEPAGPPLDEREHDWDIRTMEAALERLVALFLSYHRTLAFILPDVLNVIGQCVARSSPRLVGAAVKSLRTLLVDVLQPAWELGTVAGRGQAWGSLGPVHFSAKDWEVACGKVTAMLAITTPSYILKAWVDPGTRRLVHPVAEGDDAASNAFRPREPSPPRTPPVSLPPQVERKLLRRVSSGGRKLGRKPSAQPRGGAAAKDRAEAVPAPAPAPACPAGAAPVHFDTLNLQLQAHCRLLGLVEQCLRAVLRGRPAAHAAWTVGHVGGWLAGLRQSAGFVERWLEDPQHFLDFNAVGAATTIVDLFEQERQALEGHLKTLFLLHSCGADVLDGNWGVAPPCVQLATAVERTVGRMQALNEQAKGVPPALAPRFTQELQVLSSGMLLVLTACRSLPDADFLKFVPLFYLPFLDLMVQQGDNGAVLAALRQYLARLGALQLGIAAPATPTGPPAPA